MHALAQARVDTGFPIRLAPAKERVKKSISPWQMEKRAPTIRA